MKGYNLWSYAPYRPFFHNVGDIYICRIAPNETTIHFEWLDIGAGDYSVFYRLRDEKDFICYGKTQGTEFDITNLEPETDYEFYVQAGEKTSLIRLARTGKTVGTVVNYLHPDDKVYSFSGRYLCSPSLVRHPDGFLLASMDLYASDHPQNLTLIFRSDDEGESWHYVSELMPCFWGKMFIHKGELYMLSCSTEYGDLLIGKSTDGGKTFSTPTVLLRGSCKSSVAGVHKNPQPPVEYEGRIWVTMEWGAWREGYHAAMIGSAPADEDLTDASVWLFSEPVKYDQNWKGVAQGQSTGNIEGTLVVLPDGKLYNIMRYDMVRCTPNYGLVLAYSVNTEYPESPLEYNRAISLPGNHSKFMIRYDTVTNQYYTIISRILDSNHIGDRNLLTLMQSADAEHWSIVCDLLDYRDSDPHKVGFQYVDFFIEGEDLLWLCRTAFNNAASYHDANYSTFHRIHNFRKYLNSNDDSNMQ